MQLAAYIISLCLHIAIFLLIWFWPAPAPLKLDAPPIMISLVAGEKGGNRLPSPILGHTGDETGEEKAPQTPAPKNEIASQEKTGEAAPQPAQASQPEEPVPIKPAPKPEPVPEKKPEPVREKAEPVSRPEQKKPESSKPDPKKEPPKPEPKKEPVEKPKPAQPKTPKRDPVAEALAKAKKAASRSSGTGSAVERALAEARRNSGGNAGGGGGSGDGPGGGGLGDVYIGQIMLAVRPNWGFASSSRINLVCIVKVNVDMQGKVLNAAIERSSGNAQYDASAVNAVMRTSQAGDFPPPPNPSYTELDLVFTFDEIRAR